VRTGGSPSAAGHYYKLDVSIWAAVDLLLAKRIAEVLTLEPTSEEDLEAELTERKLGPVAMAGDLGSYRLVVQAKLRDTGQWSAPAIARLLAHGGPERTAPRDRLKDEHVRYLLITSADLAGAARRLRVGNLGEWPSAAARAGSSLRSA
jgi:hypothetical protein